MTSIVSQIPARFFEMRYDQGHDASSSILPPLEVSPNCQNFAYELLAAFGFRVPLLRSSELWEDKLYTTIVREELRALDLLLFNHTDDAWGAHVAVCVGGDQAIHLSKRISSPEVIEISKLPKRPQYRRFLGAKRPIVRIPTSQSPTLF